MKSNSTSKKCFVLAHDSDDDEEFSQLIDTPHRITHGNLSQSSEGGATLSEDGARTPQEGAKTSPAPVKPFSKNLALEVQEILNFQRSVGSAKMKEQIVSTLAAVGGAYAPLCKGSSFVVWSRYTELSAKALADTKLLLDKANASGTHFHCSSEQVKETCVRSGKKVGFRLPLPSKSGSSALPSSVTKEASLLSTAELLALSVLTQTESDASLQSTAYSLHKASAQSSPDMLLDIYNEDIDVFFDNEAPTTLTRNANKRPRDGEAENGEEEDVSTFSNSRCSLSAAVLHRQNEHTRVNWMTN